MALPAVRLSLRRASEVTRRHGQRESILTTSMPREPEFFGVAHPAVDLHSLAGYPFGRGADVGLDHRCFGAPGGSGHQPGDPVGELPAGLDDDGHPRELGLGELVVESRLAE
jgi:hypothetical protein